MCQGLTIAPGGCGRRGAAAGARAKSAWTGPGRCGAILVKGPVLIRVHTWSDDTIGMVRARVDDQPWTTLEVDERVGSCWSAPLHGERLCKGEHTLEVEAGGEDDAWSLRSIRFVGDPTGRYTALPRVEPPVERTAFW